MSNAPLLDRTFAALDALAGDGPQPLGVAVSGGSDSTALLRLAIDWARLRGRSLCVATVDHGLRPEAAEEAAFVARLCRRFDIVCETLTWRPPDGGASQAQARRARHALLGDWARARGVSRLALGHTRDDVVETLLMRARTGSTWFGLAAPDPISASPAWPEGRGVALVRPLLASDRAELRDYLSDRGQDWCEDPSNRSDAYERVRMRRLIQALPASRRQAMRGVADRLAMLRQARKAQIRQVSAMAVDWRPDGEGRLDLSLAVDAPRDVLTRLVQCLLLAASGRRHPPPLDAVASLVEALADGAEAATLGGAWVRADAQNWSFLRAPEGDARTPGALASPPMALVGGDAKVWDGRYLVGLAASEAPGDILSYDAAQRVASGKIDECPATPVRRTLPILVRGDQRLAPDFGAQTGFFATALQAARFESLLQ